MTALVLISLMHCIDTICTTIVLCCFNYCYACNNMSYFESTSGSNRQTVVTLFLLDEAKHLNCFEKIA